MVQEVAEQNLRGCTTLIQVRKVAELDWRDFPTNLPTFVPTFVLGNIYKWLICICILIDFERIARSIDFHHNSNSALKSREISLWVFRCDLYRLEFGLVFARKMG